MQSAYLCGCIKIVDIARHYNTSGSQSRRQFSRECYVSSGVVSTRICKVAFLRIHAISNGRVDRALKAQKISGGAPHIDKRGRHRPANKTAEEDINMVKAHIKSFPSYKSHYSRKDNPSRKFLSPCLSVQKMYELYKERCDEEDTHKVSEWVYRKVFNESFNFSFGT